MELIIIILTAVCALYYIMKNIKRDKKPCCHHVSDAPDNYDEQSEVVVVGAGIFGSAIAAALSQDGRKVIVIERDLSEPCRIVGELLQPGGCIALEKLGLQAAVENIDAHTVYGYVVHDQSSGSNVSLSYPVNENNSIMTGRSFHHGRFVMGLRREARKLGATLLEGTASSLLQNKEGNVVGICYRDKSTSCIKSIKADLTIVADGCFSKFRKGLISSSVTVCSHFVGLIMHGCPQHRSGHAEIILTTNGPVLVYQISSSATRILIDIQGKMPANVDQYLRENILPQLTDSIQKPFEEALRKERIRSMPNSFLPPLPILKSGVLLLGDAFNMRHPLTGAGMSVALNDVLILRGLLSDIPDLKNYDQVVMQQKKFLWKRKGSHSFVTNVLAQALYELFSASDSNLYNLRKACFEYFRLGGRAVTGPVGLLSIIHPNPLTLIGHFFAVAIYGVYLTMTSCKAWQLHHGILSSATMFAKACKIIVPLIKSEL